MIALTRGHRQIPLIHFIESDDLFLDDQVDAVWFDVLRALDYHAFQVTAAHYYEQLFTFNQEQKQRRNERRENPPPPNPETRGQATQRTLLERATLDDQAPILHEQPQPSTPLTYVAPHEVVPGVTPLRFVGRPPKCFFAMLYAFLGTTFARQPAEPEFVHQRLRENPAFARTCGFTIPRPGKLERQSDIPSLRKLQQFDQIMTAAGLWEELALDRVAANLREGKIKVEETLVHDTTHYHAFSSRRVIELSEVEKESSAPTNKATIVKVDGNPVAEIETATTETNVTAPTSKTAKTHDKKAAAKPKSKAAKNRKSGGKFKKKKRKSHPRVTKNCRCKDRQHCDHAWINADLGAGTVFKSTGKMYWGHKASTLGFGEQEILLDAVAMSDASSHDSQTLVPHMSRLFQRHPDLRGAITRVLDDGAADDSQLKASIREQFGIELLAPINPRRRKPIRGQLPRGIDHLTSRGVPVCETGYPFELLGFRKATENFLFRAPRDAEGEPVCQGCELRADCYRGESGSRVVTISADRLPWLDREFPQLSKRFAKAMARRTSIERLHKLMKFDLGDDRLTKRGNGDFQARLDKTLLAMHVLQAHEF